MPVTISPITSKRVSITSVDLTKGICLCRDTLGKEETVRADRRPKGSAPPSEGELWMLRREGGGWVLDSMLQVSPTPVVTGSRATADPVTLSLLAALKSLGLIKDATTP
jgi:hypothetical protein